MIILVFALDYIHVMRGNARFPEFTRSFIEEQKKQFGLETVIDRITQQMIYPHPRTFVPVDVVTDSFAQLCRGVSGDYQILVDYFEPDCERRLEFFNANKRKLVEKCVKKYYKVYPELLATLIEENFVKPKTPTVWEMYEKVKDSGCDFLIDNEKNPALLVVCSALGVEYEGYESKRMREFFPNARTNKKNVLKF